MIQLTREREREGGGRKKCERDRKWRERKRTQKYYASFLNSSVAFPQTGSTFNALHRKTLHKLTGDLQI